MLIKREGMYMASISGNLSNQSTEKAFAVLEFLVAQPEPLKLLEISKMMGMNASTVSRYLSALQNCGYVEQDPLTTRYSVSTKICQLANIVLSRFQLAPFAHPYVQKVSDYFGETSCLSVERNSATLYIDIVVSVGKTLMNVQRVGNSAPLHCTASGKLFLSQYSGPELDQYIQEKGLTRYTDATITDKDALIAELDKIRRQGYSMDVEENETGIRCIASPIFDRYHKIVACLSITGPTARLTDELVEEKRLFLSQTTEELSEKLNAIGSFNI